MKCLPPVYFLFAMTLTAALTACGSSPNETNSNSSNNQTSTVGNANTSVVAGSTAIVNLTGTLGSLSLTGKDAVYEVANNGQPVPTIAISDSNNLCESIGSTSTLNGNLILVQLAGGVPIVTGNYLVNPDLTSTDPNVQAAVSAAAGSAAVGILAASPTTTPFLATSGNVNLSTYVTDSLAAFTLSAYAADSAGVTGNVSAPHCAGLLAVPRVKAALSGTGLTTVIGLIPSTHR